MGNQAGPHADALTLSDAGRGRLGRGGKRSVILQRRAPDGWVDVQRFSDPSTASSALDAAIASGDKPDDLRLSVVPQSRAKVMLVACAVVLLAVAAAVGLGLILFSS